MPLSNTGVDYYIPCHFQDRLYQQNFLQQKIDIEKGLDQTKDILLKRLNVTGHAAFVISNPSVEQIIFEIKKSNQNISLKEQYLNDKLICGWGLIAQTLQSAYYKINALNNCHNIKYFSVKLETSLCFPGLQFMNLADNGLQIMMLGCFIFGIAMIISKKIIEKIQDEVYFLLKSENDGYKISAFAMINQIIYLLFFLLY